MPVFGNNGAVMGTGGKVGYPCCCDNKKCPTDCSSCPAKFTVTIGYGGGFPCNSVDLAKSLVLNGAGSGACGWSGETASDSLGDPFGGISCITIDGKDMWYLDVSICWHFWTDPATNNEYLFTGGYEASMGIGACPDPGKLVEKRNEIDWFQTVGGSDSGTCTFEISVA